MAFLTAKRKGFTLIELLITIAIIGILAAIAIPSYQNYNRRNYYSQIVQASAPYRVAVGECVEKARKLEGCNAGTHNIPEAIKSPKGPVAILQVQDGVITVTPATSHGITAADTYILTPRLNAENKVSWAVSGGSVKARYVKSVD